MIKMWNRNKYITKKEVKECVDNILQFIEGTNENLTLMRTEIYQIATILKKMNESKQNTSSSDIPNGSKNMYQ